MNLGIIQGRLSPPLEGFQECPLDWKRELDLLPKAKLSHIEWIVTKNSFSNNPLFYEDLKNAPIHSICADNLVDENIVNTDYVSHNLIPLCLAARKNNIPSVTVPLLENSSLENDNKREVFTVLFEKIVNMFPQLIFSLEAELPSDKLIDLISISDNVFVTYDTGNITSCGYDHEEYISNVGHRISNVHLKDRTIDGVSVSPGSGDTNFVSIFRALKKFNYDGPFTLQTARGLPTKELDTAKSHYSYFRGMYE